MTALKNSYLLFVAGILSLSSCIDKEQKHGLKGYFNSTAYRDYLGSNKGENSDGDYTTKRLFMLLGEEGFLYDPNYNLYAVYLYMHNIRDSVDFYILKSKNNITSFSLKRHYDSTRSLLYVEKENKDEFENKVIKLEVSSKLVDNDLLPLIDQTFKKAISLKTTEGDHFPEYHSPIRGLYLFDGKEYYLITDYNLESSAMNEIDSFFRKSTLIDIPK